MSSLTISALGAIISDLAQNELATSSGEGGGKDAAPASGGERGAKANGLAPPPGLGRKPVATAKLPPGL